MRKARGFTIIELLVVMVIVSLLVAMAAVITRAITSQQRRSLTATRIQGVDAAIVQFVMQQRRLPCPADGSLASANANAGIESNRNSAGCQTDQTAGVVPWLALGLTEADITDGWERRITYRIQAALAADNALDMTSCDPAGTGGAAGNPCLPVPGCANATLGACTAPATFLSNRGLAVQTVAGVVTMNPAGSPPTGAAYILISHGESGGGAYLNSGQLSTTTAADGTEEQKNYASLALRTAPGQAYYVDDGLSEAPGATHFDDVVSRPSLLSVISKAGLGPRSH